MPQMILIQSQVAFYAKEKIREPDLLSARLRENTSLAFDEQPLVVPLPNDEQFDTAPAVKLTSSTAPYSINISRKRLDFFWDGQGEQQFADVQTELMEKSRAIYADIASRNIPINRLGFLTNFFVTMTPEKVGRVLASVVTDSFKDAHGSDQYTEGVIQLLSVRKREEYSVSETTKFASAAVEIGLPTGIDPREGIMVTRDFNTRRTEDLSVKMNKTFLRSFLTESVDAFRLAEIQSIWQQG